MIGVSVEKDAPAAVSKSPAEEEPSSQIECVNANLARVNDSRLCCLPLRVPLVPMNDVQSQERL